MRVERIETCPVFETTKLPSETLADARPHGPASHSARATDVPTTTRGSTRLEAPAATKAVESETSQALTRSSCIPEGSML